MSRATTATPFFEPSTDGLKFTLSSSSESCRKALETEWVNLTSLIRIIINMGATWPKVLICEVEIQIWAKHLAGIRGKNPGGTAESRVWFFFFKSGEIRCFPPMIRSHYDGSLDTHLRAGSCLSHLNIAELDASHMELTWKQVVLSSLCCTLFLCLFRTYQQKQSPHRQILTSRT